MGKGWSECVAKEWDFTIAQNVLRTSLPSTHTTALQITPAMLWLFCCACRWAAANDKAPTREPGDNLSYCPIIKEPQKNLVSEMFMLNVFTGLP